MRAPSTTPIVTAIGDSLITALNGIGQILDKHRNPIGSLVVEKETVLETSHLLAVLSAGDANTHDNDDTYQVLTQNYEVSVWWMPSDNSTPVDEAKEAIWASIETAVMQDIQRGNLASKTTVMGCSRQWDESGDSVFVVSLQVDFFHPWGQPYTTY